MKEVPASNEVLDSPFGIPHGGGVRTLSRKSRLRDLASGKSSLTWPLVPHVNTSRTKPNNLFPVGVIAFKKPEKKNERKYKTT